MNKISIVLLSSLFALAFLTENSLGQTTNRRLSDLRVSIKADRQPLGIIFRELMQKYQIDVGFEQSMLDNRKWYFSFDTNMPMEATHSQNKNSGVKIEITAQSAFKAGPYPISRNIENKSVKDLFNAIVPQMGNYNWKMRDGVVNIYPVRGRDPRFKELLDRKVKRFYLPAGSKVEDIITTLLALPEFRDFRRSHNFTFSPIREGVNVLIEAQYGRLIGPSIDLTNIRFRDLLNKITKIKKGGWILKLRGKTREGGDLGDLDI